MGSQARLRVLPAIAGLVAGTLVLGIVVIMWRTTDPYHDPAVASVNCLRTRLTIFASPEKYTELHRIADDFNEFRCDNTPAVSVQSKSSGEALTVLSKGGTGAGLPQVWSPAATGWVRLLQHASAARGTDPVQNEDADGQIPSVTRTPLVLAMPQPIADTLGDVGWADIAQWAADPKLWNQRSNGRFGDFKLGKTDPNLSTSGLHSLIAAYTAAAGRVPEVGDVDNKAITDKVHSVEQTAAHYGDTTLDYLCALAKADKSAGTSAGGSKQAVLDKIKSYVTVVPVEEKSVYEYNTGNQADCPEAKGYRPTVPLTAVYPSDNTVWSDSPYAILRANVTPDQRKLADNFLRYVHDKDAPDSSARHADRYRKPQEILMNAGFRGVATDHLAAGVLAAPGLQADPNLRSMIVPDPAAVDAIRNSWTGLRKSARVLLLVDVSGSMGYAPVARKDRTGRKLQEAKGDRRMDRVVEALSAALKKFEHNSMYRFGLWTFAGSKHRPDAEKVHKLIAEPDADATAVQDRIAGLNPELNGDTALYESTIEARTSLAGSSDKYVTAVVVLSDGEDDMCVEGDATCEKRTADRLAELTGAPKEWVRVFTVAYSPDAPMPDLNKIAEANGTDIARNSTDPTQLQTVMDDLMKNF